MSKRHWSAFVLLSLTVAISLSGSAFGRGGRGGGGGFGGGGGQEWGVVAADSAVEARPAVGGGGGSRPSGGFNGGGGPRPGGPTAGGGRPSIGSSPSFSRPGNAPARNPISNPVAGTRPGLGGGNLSPGNRPPLQPGTRPHIGIGGENRPSTLPGNRPGIGSGQGIGSGAGIANRPGIGGAGIGTRPGTGPGQGLSNRPAISQRPATLPGLGGGDRLPNQGAGIQDRMTNRQTTISDRQANLSDRMTTGREDWQQHREDMQGNRQDWRNQNREDWQNWADNNHGQHGDWYHDSWHGDWYPGSGWNYMWDNHPVAAAFGVTAWGVNRLAYGFGYSDYSNPYAGSGSSSGETASYDYSQPLVSYADDGTSASNSNPAAASDSTASPSPQPSDPGMTAFNEARVAFTNGDAATALTLLDTTLKTMPHDTVVHEFRGLVLFALQRYPESAAAVYAVLSAGPGWDWTTLSSLYSSVDVYTKQLRTLEDFAKTNPKSADAHFLLGYHYLTTGFAEAASKQFQAAQLELPDDKLLAQLVSMTTPPDASKKTGTSTPPVLPAIPPEKVLTAEKMVGTWKSASPTAQFQLDLEKDGRFVWTYVRGKDKQSVKGVFAVDQNNLALEPDAGGTMLAEIDFADPTSFLFKIIGGDEKDPGLKFKKS